MGILSVVNFAGLTEKASILEAFFLPKKKAKSLAFVRTRSEKLCDEQAVTTGVLSWAK